MSCAYTYVNTYCSPCKFVQLARHGRICCLGRTNLGGFQGKQVRLFGSLAPSSGSALGQSNDVRGGVLTSKSVVVCRVGNP
jgi:hypothetical protein